MIHFNDLITCPLQCLRVRLRLRFVLERQLHTIVFAQTSSQAARRPIGSGCLQGDIDRPGFLGDESCDLPLAFYDQAQGHTLYAAGAQAIIHLAPEQLGDVIPDKAVKDAARLLRIDQGCIERARLLEGLTHGVGSDFMKDNAMHALRLHFRRVCEVPGDGLSFAIRVGGEVDALRSRGLRAQALHHFAFLIRHAIGGAKTILHIHR